MTTLVAFIITIGVLVFVHELGHFLAAKWAGIHVHRFSLGLGSPIPGLRFTRSGTEYCIAWVPLGGYVKMATREEEATSSALEGGSVDASSVPPDAYYEAKPVWKRMIVILAGVTMNALFAWLAFSGLALANGVAVEPETRFGAMSGDSLPESVRNFEAVSPGARIVSVNGQPVDSWNDVQDLTASAVGDSLVYAFADAAPVVLPIHHDDLDARLRLSVALLPWMDPVIGQVIADYPGGQAGLAPGDTVVQADGRVLTQWYDLVGIIESSADRLVTLVVGRASGRDTIVATPRGEIVTAGREGRRTVGRLGITAARQIRRAELGPLQSLNRGLHETAQASTQIVRTVRGMLTGRVSTREVGGPILIGQLAGEAVRSGPSAFLWFMALISVNLAVLNLLPIPVLDGGQFLFLLAEGIQRKPLSLKLRERLTAVGLAMLLLLIGLVFWNDISRLVTGAVG
ncbi:MAG: RIP metalloprotease RseP [Gemmatimonadales bacterium]